MTDLSDVRQLDWSAFWRVLPKDMDPVETREWLESLDAVIRSEGKERATYLLRKLLDHARDARVPMPPVLNTPYVNSIPLEAQPQYPGDLDIENRLSAIIRWNALAIEVGEAGAETAIEVLHKAGHGIKKGVIGPIELAAIHLSQYLNHHAGPRHWSHPGQDRAGTGVRDRPIGSGASFAKPANVLASGQHNGPIDPDPG
jgi:hypothetical protein